MWRACGEQRSNAISAVLDCQRSRLNTCWLSRPRLINGQDSSVVRFVSSQGQPFAFPPEFQSFFVVRDQGPSAAKTSSVVRFGSVPGHNDYFLCGFHYFLVVSDQGCETLWALNAQMQLSLMHFNAFYVVSDQGCETPRALNVHMQVSHNEFQHVWARCLLPQCDFETCGSSMAPAVRHNR